MTEKQVKAVEKLQTELKNAQNKNYADPIINHLIGRCKDDEGLCEDVLQNEKTFSKCFDYVRNQAKKQAKNGCAAVKDDVVYEWAEDYYHKEEKKATPKKSTTDNNGKKETSNPVPVKEKKEEPSVEKATTEELVHSEPVKEESKPAPVKVKKAPKKKEIEENQMSLFDFLG